MKYGVGYSNEEKSEEQIYDANFFYETVGGGLILPLDMAMQLKNWQLGRG